MDNSYAVVENFINDNCVIQPSCNVKAIDLITNINIKMGTSFNTRGSFPTIMTKYILSHPNITKKRTANGICYIGLDLKNNDNRVDDRIKSLIKESLQYTDDQYEYIRKNKLIKPLYNNGILQENETLEATVNAINAEYHNILLEVKRCVKSVNIVAKEYEKAKTHDLIQSILQVNPNYEPMYMDNGELINPYFTESLPLIYDRRLNMEQVCIETCKTIKNYHTMIDKLNMLFIQIGSTRDKIIPTLDASTIEIITEGSLSRHEYEKKTKEYLKRIES